MSKFDEQILVVSREELFSNEENAFNGFLGNDNESVAEIVKSFSNIQVKRRGDMEEDPTYKQLIGYALVRDMKTKELLVYTRLTGGGESRLHGKSSVGVGGHMNLVENKTIEESIKINVSRELEEEIGVSFESNLEDIKFIGLINDDTNEVGKVHLGLVYEVYVNKEEIKNIEDDSLEIQWLSSSLAKELNSYESWSDYLKPIM